MGEFVGADYRDEWKGERVLLMERLRGVFPALPNARIESNIVFVKANKGGGSWTARITVKSTGEFAGYFQNRVNSLDSPFEFEWKRGETWPWTGNWSPSGIPRSKFPE